MKLNEVLMCQHFANVHLTVLVQKGIIRSLMQEKWLMYSLPPGLIVLMLDIVLKASNELWPYPRVKTPRMNLFPSSINRRPEQTSPFFQHDWGLYAMEGISRGEMVIKYVGEVVIRAQASDKREKAWYERQATKKGSLG